MNYVTTHPPPRTVLVLAPTLPIFRRWCHRHGVNWQSRHVRYVTSSHQLLGARGHDLVFLPDWGFHRTSDFIDEVKYRMYDADRCLPDTAIPIVQDGHIYGWQEENYATNT